MDDVLGRATALTTISFVAGSVVGKVWSAEQARAGRVQHFLKQLLRDSWDYAADHSGRLTMDIRYRVAEHIRAADGGLAALATTNSLTELVI